MTLELTVLAWTLVLAVVQVVLPTLPSIGESGLMYNLSARDEPAGPPSKLHGRLSRAQRNLFESLPIFAAAILIAHAAGRESALTAHGAELFLAARVIYVPVYALGIPVLRTLVWTASMVGLVMILIALLGS